MDLVRRTVSAVCRSPPFRSALFVCLFALNRRLPVSVPLLLCSFVALFAAVYFPPIEVNKRVINNDRGPFVSKCVTACGGRFVPPLNCPTRQQPIAHRSTLCLCRVCL